MDKSPEVKQPSAFKLEWEAKKVLKKAKKKARNALQQRGHSHSEATHMVKQAVKQIASTDNRPERKSAGRGK